MKCKSGFLRTSKGDEIYIRKDQYEASFRLRGATMCAKKMNWCAEAAHEKTDKTRCA